VTASASIVTTTPTTAMPCAIATGNANATTRDADSRRSWRASFSSGSAGCMRSIRPRASAPAVPSNPTRTVAGKKYSGFGHPSTSIPTAPITPRATKCHMFLINRSPSSPAPRPATAVAAFPAAACPVTHSADSSRCSANSADEVAVMFGACPTNAS
jgi:hypothetical protein